MGKVIGRNNTTITIRLSQAERKKIKSYAKALGISINESLRRMIEAVTSETKNQKVAGEKGEKSIATNLRLKNDPRHGNYEKRHFSQNTPDQPDQISDLEKEALELMKVEIKDGGHIITFLEGFSWKQGLDLKRLCEIAVERYRKKKEHL